VHRAEILQVSGAWPEAMEEARRAGARAGSRGAEATADAHYREGEIHRLRGDFADAEQAFKAASQRGREPQPGLALLRLQQGQKDAALAAIRRVLAETAGTLARASFLPAAVRIFVTTRCLDDARAAARELEEIATTISTEALGAFAAHARGLVCLVEGDAQQALGPLRRAFWVWQKIGAPYEAAVVRVDLAGACRALGDDEGARLSLEAARAAFEELGAREDVAEIDALARGVASRAPHGLTQRELQVLRLVAAGKTNKVIARELFISEKTVDRHVSNIFAKVNVDSRTAATAFAYQHQLV
jgi:DNA-binding CsgD family transcriptional regulator